MPGHYPWNGTEIHWRNGNRVEASSNVHTWDNYAANGGSGTDWVCPDYRQYGGWIPGKPYWYDCSTGQEHYPTPAQGGDWFDEIINFVPNPPHGEGQESGNWYNCMAI